MKCQFILLHAGITAPCMRSLARPKLHKHLLLTVYLHYFGQGCNKKPQKIAESCYTPSANTMIASLMKSVKCVVYLAT